MSVITRMRFIKILVFILIFLSGSTAYAHNGEPRLEINIERINPGGVIDVRGVEFDYEEAAALYLERPGIMIQAGEVIADLEGIFLQTIVLPADLPEGVYNFRAVSDHHEVMSPAVVVQGSAILSEGREQDNRDEHDNLLVPIPTFAPGVVPGGVSPAETGNSDLETPVKTDATPNWTVPLLISSLFFSIGIMIWARRRFLRRL